MIPSPLDWHFSLLWERPKRLPNLPAMRAFGESFGYPECCIEDFLYDVALHRYPGMLRGSDPTGRYVPCRICASIHQTGRFAGSFRRFVRPHAV